MVPFFPSRISDTASCSRFLKMLYSMGHAKGKYQYLGWHRSMGLKENHYTLNPLICHCRKWVKRLYKHSLREVAHRFETPCQSLKYERPSSIIAVGP